MAFRDWLPALIGGAVGAADPQSGQALVGTISMADAFKRRRIMDQRTAAAEAKANEQFEWAREQHAEADRQRIQAEHERMLTDQARQKFDFTGWTEDAIAAANAAETPVEFAQVVEMVTGRKYRESGERRAEAGEQRVSEAYTYGVSRRPTEEHYAETGHQLSQAAGGRAQEQYEYGRTMRPFEVMSSMSPLLSSFLMSTGDLGALTNQLRAQEELNALPPTREGEAYGEKAPRKVTDKELERDPELANLEKQHKLEGSIKTGKIQEEISTNLAKAKASLAQIEAAANALPDGHPAKALMLQQAAELRKVLPPEPGAGVQNPDAVAGLVNKYAG